MKKVFLLSLFATASCASILQGNVQKISVRLQPDVPGKCHLTQRSVAPQNFVVPAEINVSRSYYPFDISCTPDIAKMNVTPGQARVYSDVSSLGYTGAIASVGVGTIVDTATGDAFDYPSQITVKIGETTEIGRDHMNDNVEFDK